MRRGQKRGLPTTVVGKESTATPKGRGSSRRKQTRPTEDERASREEVDEESGRSDEEAVVVIPESREAKKQRKNMAIMEEMIRIEATKIAEKMIEDGRRRQKASTNKGNKRKPTEQEEEDVGEEEVAEVTFLSTNGSSGGTTTARRVRTEPRSSLPPASSSPSAGRLPLRKKKKTSAGGAAANTNGGLSGRVELLRQAADFLKKQILRDPSDVELINKYGKVQTTLLEGYKIRIGSPFENKDDEEGARTATGGRKAPVPGVRVGTSGGSSSRSITTTRSSNLLATPPDKNHFSYLRTRNNDSLSGGNEMVYRRDERTGSFIAINADTSADGSGDVAPVSRLSRHQRDGDDDGELDGGGGTKLTLAPKMPFETLNSMVTDDTIKTLSDNPRKAGSQGGPNVSATIFNLSSSKHNDQESGGGGGGVKTTSKCDMQIETTGLLPAALNPASVEVDRFADLSLLLDPLESRASLRSYRHTFKKHQDLPFKTFEFIRLDELDTAISNYVELANAVFILKHPIYVALRQAAEAGVEFARNAPRNGRIMRLIAAHFFEGVEDVLRAAGSGLTVRQVVEMVDAIDFEDPRAAHQAAIVAHHMQRFNPDGSQKQNGAESKQPSAAAAQTNGAAGDDGDGGDADDAKKRRKKQRERVRLKKLDDGKKDNRAPRVSALSVCPFFCSTRGCDPDKTRNGRPCKPARHVLPTTEGVRVAVCEAMNKYALTARSDFPKSCPLP